MTGESFTNARCRPERASSRRMTTSPLSSAPKPGFVQHRPRPGDAVQREHRLHGGGLGIGPDDVGLGAGPTQEEDGVDQDGLAAPVSPVSAFRPGANGAVTDSTTARFLTRTSRSIS